MRRTRKQVSALDICLALILFSALLYLFYRIKVGLNYNWDWGVIPQYLIRYDPVTESWKANLLLQGFFTTIRLSIWSTVLAMIFGTLMGFFRSGRSVFNRLVGGTYVEMIRNLPPLVLVFIFYFFVSNQLMPLLGMEHFVRGLSEPSRAILAFFFAPAQRFNAFFSAVFTLALFEGAYITEIVRAGIQSIEREQWEASAALGMTRFQQMRHIILPQAFQRILPALAGQFISTIKDSSIVSIISIQELTFQGLELMAATHLTFEIWITITILYLILTLTCSLAVERLEVRLGRS
ncbi:MAG: amino acid ABC transporter permease, partial [Desulfococcaceae bacterium]